ncbi:cytidylate kinase-like family protein [Lacrimispora sp. 210928-DFI.3.58]|uniref:cytidylate kinase-like family protein n=1 Tax=Lacrimispora sp. 210928-DFI.3.58 TaxID=2883214 RepID=UPI001D094F9C|nr:cytidylate kinase-like family protein [Lacrimispora sp. 210928-DFI.3.58]MCB7320813.1 cytidylate kinase-like family protein [Lacrimispora sp. 210928-DFI.3.58]
MSKVITISRQYGSGGKEMGEKLAKRLGIPFYGKELIAMIAEEGDIEPAILEAHDDLEPDVDGFSVLHGSGHSQTSVTQRIYAAQEAVIKRLAEEGPSVIVGRCADAILPQAINIYVYADLECRIRRIMQVHPELARYNIKANIQAVDKRRKAYHEYYSTAEWGKMEAYDICLNSGLIGVDGCVEVALSYIERVK